jgi:MtrB/PioB family decaheme-associated outer membrane protein
MRTRIILFVAALLACWAPAARAQQATGQQPAEQTPTVNPWSIALANWLDAGARGTNISGDEARFDRFRDTRSGPFLDRFRFQDSTGPGIFSLALDNIGYRDQRYFGRFEVPGRVRFSAEWNQVPTFWSISTRSAYTGVGTSTQTLPSGFAAAVQASPSSLASLYTPLAQANPFDTRSRRDTFTLNFLYTPTTNLGINVNLSSTRRNGNQPWVMSFGFGQSVEVASPVDTRTTDLSTGAEWATDRGMLRVNYDGSWFKDSQQTLTVDNPLRATDSTAGSSRGRMALWPSNNAHTVTGAGAIRLPGRSRLTANLAIGTWRQDQPLLPPTVNSALNAATPPRATAQADIRRVAANVVFTTRPANFLGVTARYRLHDFKDESPEQAIPLIFQYDQGLPTSDTPPIFSHRYNDLDVEATITSLQFLSLSGGYRLRRADRTERVFGITTDNAVYASVDSVSMGIVSLHAIFEHARRRGSDYDPTVLTGAGEYPGLRRYDIADRDRNRVTAMLQVMPTSSVAISGSITAAKDDFPNNQFGAADAFGLQNRTAQGYAIFFDATPRDTVTVGAGYGYQIYSSLQRSRQVSAAPPTPQQQDPSRDWTLSEDEKVHYVSANLELAHLFPKTAVRFTYDYNRAESPYTYALAASSVLTPPSQLPPVLSGWHTATIDVRYFLRRNLAAGFTYWYDRYTVSDYAMGAQIEDQPAIPGIILLGYGYRPYTVNSVWARLLYIF